MGWALLLALATATVTVNDLGRREKTTHYPRHEGHKFVEHTVNLDTGRVLYAIKYCACIDPAHKGRAAPLEGYIGMPRPTSCNWYHSGFLFVRINGVDIGTFFLKSMRVVESGERGAVDLFWDADPARVRVRFLALPGDDKLLCEIALQPKVEVKTFQIMARCYPSYFTAYHGVRGRRTLVTVKRKAHEGEKGPTKVEVEPSENWLFVCDEVFDPAEGKGEGPCALLFLPEQVARARVELTNYPVSIILEMRPEVRLARLAFWEFPRTGNVEALRRLREEAPRTEKLLRQISFVPRTLLKFSSLKERKEVEMLCSRLKGWPKLRQFAELARKLLRVGERLREQERKGEIDLALENWALSHLEVYERLKWEAKFEELFAE